MAMHALCSLLEMGFGLRQEAELEEKQKLVEHTCEEREKVCKCLQPVHASVDSFIIVKQKIAERERERERWR